MGHSLIPYVSRTRFVITVDSHGWYVNAIPKSPNPNGMFMALGGPHPKIQWFIVQIFPWPRIGDGISLGNHKKSHPLRKTPLFMVPLECGNDLQKTPPFCFVERGCFSYERGMGFFTGCHVQKLLGWTRHLMGPSSTHKKLVIWGCRSLRITCLWHNYHVVRKLLLVPLILI